MNALSPTAPHDGAPSDPPGARPAAAPNIVQTYMEEDGGNTASLPQAGHKRRYPDGCEDGFESGQTTRPPLGPPATRASATAQPDAAPAPADEALPTETSAAATATVVPHAGAPAPSAQDRSLASSVHAPPAPADEVEAALQKAARHAVAAGTARAHLFGGLLTTLKEAEALGAICPATGSILRAAMLAATRTEIAPSVDQTALDPLLSSLQTWLTDAWFTPPAPSTRKSASSSASATQSATPGCAAPTATGTTAPNAQLRPEDFLPLAARRPAKSRSLLPLRDMVVEGGGKNSAFNIAQQGGRHDNRVLLRLAADNAARHHSERSLCQMFNTKLAASGCKAHVKVMQVKKTNGGLALAPARGCSSDELYGCVTVLESAVDADGSARHQQWDKYVISGVAMRVARWRRRDHGR
ncbi:hypothetical protein CF327_g5487 [Tilletia walkeri]|nr:hypothetical protein CF327_g5487 [Tilletia walkeri]